MLKLANVMLLWYLRCQGMPAWWMHSIAAVVVD
jgi:hypothetical protein